MIYTMVQNFDTLNTVLIAQEIFPERLYHISLGSDASKSPESSIWISVWKFFSVQWDYGFCSDVAMYFWPSFLHLPGGGFLMDWKLWFNLF